MLLVGQSSVQGQFGHADNAVHGGPDLMAHIGEEFAFGPVGILGGLLGCKQFLHRVFQLDGALFHPPPEVGIQFTHLRLRGLLLRHEGLNLRSHGFHAPGQLAQFVLGVHIDLLDGFPPGDTGRRGLERSDRPHDPAGGESPDTGDRQSQQRDHDRRHENHARVLRFGIPVDLIRIDDLRLHPLVESLIYKVELDLFGTGHIDECFFPIAFECLRHRHILHLLVVFPLVHEGLKSDPFRIRAAIDNPVFQALVQCRGEFLLLLHQLLSERRIRRQNNRERQLPHSIERGGDVLRTAANLLGRLVDVLHPGEGRPGVGNAVDAQPDEGRDSDPDEPKQLETNTPVDHVRFLVIGRQFETVSLAA